MNLLEQLGGYEAAKMLFNKAPSWSDTYLEPTKEYVLICVKINDGLHLSLTDIGEALLEYRREHNIFEVGDLIAYINGDTDGFVNKQSLFNVVSVVGDVLRIKDIDIDVDYLDIFDYATIFRHATDDEIKAGKRL